MKSFCKIFFLLTWIIVLFGCSTRNVSSGRAVVTGTLTDSLIDGQNNTYAVITFSFPNILLGNRVEYQTTVKPDGSFTIDLPVVSPTYSVINVESQEYDGSVLLSPGKTTHLNLILNKTGKLDLQMIEGVEIKPEEFENIGMVNRKIMMIAAEGSNSPKIQLPITPKAYSDSMLIKMKKDLSTIYEDSILSENLKNLLSNFLKQFYLNANFFNYEENMRSLYINSNRHEGKKDNAEAFVPQQPDKSYYAFLQHFDLNNPPQLNDMYYSKNLQRILSKPELAIPHIGDTPITDWIKEVKAILIDLTGINSGLFYDMLAAEAYINQLHDELNPLSEKQKENIQTYFSNSSFIDVLLEENKKTILRVQQIEKNKQTNVIVNETPAVAKGELLDAIVSKYKGKAVLVDFWATWCGPCIDAMKDIDSIKKEFSNKNIVFVYITNVTSPKELWEKKIQEIGNEHYYLNKKEWESITYSKQYGFNGIPTYIFFDSNGILKNKFIGYPGNEKMRIMIKELLP